MKNVLHLRKYTYNQWNIFAFDGKYLIFKKIYSIFNKKIFCTQWKIFDIFKNIFVINKTYLHSIQNIYIQWKVFHDKIILKCCQKLMQDIFCLLPM